jgi:hypothetical protein
MMSPVFTSSAVMTAYSSTLPCRYRITRNPPRMNGCTRQK